MSAAVIIVASVALPVSALFTASAVWWSMRAREFNAATREFQTGSFEDALVLLADATRRRQNPPWFVRLTGRGER